jgi:hypothetical protein
LPSRLDQLQFLTSYFSLQSSLTVLKVDFSLLRSPSACLLRLCWQYALQFDQLEHHQMVCLIVLLTNNRPFPSCCFNQDTSLQCFSSFPHIWPSIEHNSNGLWWRED